ncbi:multicopper oxidase family protein [Trichococcus pasteurii]|uniref:Multicopper oxidases signature 2 n=2 Tax=root TaxID=1 RepID=A0A1W1IJ47_9LACT|nr:multicopper oxidase domain-containing protein [Trichococcus pasteurii]SFF00225.1 Multicopper oxidase with three cupredoxin domains (includes cell division protein FtsP and spore coat protein CotA) [Trichococcus pasteurii]SLM53104.1 multicopper oxidases signature 2 [Trichococcus pasteurii]SSB93985.1 multicopper oxidases signature 2 [Trichococcus pasteurii]
MKATKDSEREGRIKMSRRTSLIVALVASLALLLFVSANLFSTFFNNGDNRVTTIGTDSSSAGNFIGMGHMMGADRATVLDESGQEMTALRVPELAVPDSESDSEITYTVTAQAGETAFLEGKTTQTLGYNGSYLGPVLVVNEGQEVHIKTENQLSEATSFHWHGLKVPSDIDGGPHHPVGPNETMQVDFTVNQEAATLWFHPHALRTTAEQVYAGLAGLIFVEDDNSDQLNLPKDYGVNDFPLIVQDRSFDADNQFDYAGTYDPDGTYGDTLLVNGTINPYVEVKNELVRLRLVNGSNARNYTFGLENGAVFHQIASDGGFLEQPVALKSVTLTPGERAEIIVDLSSYGKGDTVKLMDGDATVLALNVTEETDAQMALPETLNAIPEMTTQGAAVQQFTLSGMSFMVNINGNQFDMDRIDTEQSLNETVIWEVHNAQDMMGSMVHPFHIHGVQFQVLSRDGAEPPQNEQGWKDTIAVYPGETVRLAVTFPEKGVFMYHCHILEHEDNGMMGQVSVQ